jgi:two-component system, OmpR family, phosphate regulon response regulator PhoB
MSHAARASVAFPPLRQTNATPGPAPAFDDPEPRVPGEAPAGRVLVADAGEDHRASLGRSLRGWGYDVVLAGSGEEALRSCEAHPVDLALIARTLGDVSGLELCRRLRGRAGARPLVFLMLSARGDELDDLERCDVGADDYLVEPFSARELRLRVTTRLRRPAAGEAPLAPRIAASELGPVRAARRHTLGPLTVDPEGYRAFVHGREILLSATEIRLLLHLFGSRGALCGRAALLTQVWGYHPGVSSRTVDVYVKRLRDKLGAAAYLVETVRGLGYRFVDRRGPVAAAP